MADIFGRSDQVYASGFEKTDNQGVIIAGDDIHLVQDFTITYNQSVQPLYEVGSLRVWFTAAPQAGTVALNTIIGGVVESSLYDAESTDENTTTFRAGKRTGVNDSLFAPNVCEPREGTFAFDSCGGGGVFTCEGMVSTGVTVTGNSSLGHTALAVSYNFVNLKR